MRPEGFPRRTDVVIVGGGPAGTAAALSLARMGASVVNVDRPVERPALGESVPPDTRPVLEQLNLWDRFAGGSHQPAHGNRSTWGSSIPLESDFIRSPYGHGWHVDRASVDSMLVDALDRAGIARSAGTRVLSCRRTRGRSWVLGLQTGDRTWQLETDSLLDATGRSRQIARMLGIRRHTYDRLIGRVGILTPGAGTDDPVSFTEIEAAPDGWWYWSGLPDGRLAVGYMTDLGSPSAGATRTPSGWLGLLGQTTGLRTRVERHAYQLHGPLQSISAQSSRLERFTADEFCACGDAAAAYDPLSSQGILSALLSGMWAAEAIATPEHGHLTEYEARMNQVYARYLARWLGYYALESRWQASPFWSYRHRLLADLLHA